jgi:molybdenum cofactor guanylyltransferase
MGDYLTAVILAGGQSRRMGRDKALLSIASRPARQVPERIRAKLSQVAPKAIDPLAAESINSMTLLQQTCAVAKSCTDQVLVLSSIPYHLPLGCQWISEDPPYQGPLKAFAGCLKQIESEWILLLACDLPYLDAQVLQRWMGELAQVPTNSIAYLAPHIKGWECLCGFYRQQCHQSLQDFIMSGGDSFQAWLQDQQVQAITDSEPQMLINWNSPADLSSIIFVYGTLLAGESNHGLLANAEFLGADRLLNAKLYDLGEYPMILPGEGAVTGEVYRVTADTLVELDILEEHPEIYFRGQIILESGRSSQVYWGRSQHTVNCAGIACGDWRLRDR